MLEKKRKLCFAFDDNIENAILDYCYSKLLPISKAFRKANLSSACYYVCKKKGKIGIGAVRALRWIGVKIDETKLVRVRDF